MPRRFPRKLRLLSSFIAPLFTIALLVAPRIAAQDAEAQAAGKGRLSNVQAAPIAWKVPANIDASYDGIDAHRLHRYVEEQAAISLKYRDAGNQWWGRIAGMASGAEEQAWVQEKFHEIGVPAQTIEIPMTPQDLPKSWEVSVGCDGKTLRLESSQPAAGFAAAMPAALGDEELDAVWVGLGQESDFIGKDVRGKAVFIYSIPTPNTLIQSAMWMGSVARAQQRGARAVIVDVAIPGNMHYVSPMGAQRGVKTPIFTIGDADGTAVEAMNAKAAADGSALKVHLVWDVEHYPDLKEGIVIGTLPGMTDEKIVMIAHTDGYFQAATDDGAGVAALLGTAEYFAKLPKEQRRRTMYFIALPDHHGGDSGGRWLHTHFATMFANTAVLVNAEHVAAMNAVWDRPWGSSAEPGLNATNSAGPSWWGVYGSDRLAQIVRDGYAFFGVATETSEGGSPGELARTQFDAPSFYLHNKGVYYHTDADVPEIVPENTLRNAVQAFAKIFNDINQVSLADLQPPASSRPAPMTASAAK
jgi:Peptidase family M28